MTKDKHPKELYWNKNNTLLNRNHLSQDIRGRGDIVLLGTVTPTLTSSSVWWMTTRDAAVVTIRRLFVSSGTFYSYIHRDSWLFFFQLRIRDNHLSINARILKQKSYPKWRYVINNLHWHLSFKPPAGFFLPLDKYSITLSHLTRFL